VKDLGGKGEKGKGGKAKDLNINSQTGSFLKDLGGKGEKGKGVQ